MSLMVSGSCFSYRNNLSFSVGNPMEMVLMYE
jgi:hypothetical protein